MRACSKSGFGTSRCNRFVCYFGVTKSGNLFGIGNAASTTGKALNALLSAGRSCCYYAVIIRVPECVYICINVSIATVTGVGGKAFFGTSGRSCNGVIFMSKCVNTILRNKDFATTGALFTLRKTCFGTGGCYHLKGNGFPS